MKKILLCFATLSLAIASDAQVTFKTIYGSPFYDQPVAIETNNHGGYAVAGYTTAHDADANFQLFVTDAVGDTLWTKEYGFGAETLTDMKCTSDGGYILCGYSADLTGPATWETMLIKTDSAGTVQWTKYYGFYGLNNEYPNAVIQTSDGGYAVAGTLDSIFGSQFGFILKADGSGTLQWMKKYDYGMTFSELTCITQTAAGDLIAAGHASDNISRSTVVMEVDITGSFHWYHALYSSELCAPRSLLIHPGGDIYVGGTLDLNSFSGRRIFLMKLTSMGALQWTNKYNIGQQPGMFGEMIFTPAGELCVVGAVELTNYQGILFTVDLLGAPSSPAINYIQDKAYMYMAVSPGTDGGYAVLSMVDSAFGLPDSSSYLLIKTTASLSAQCGMDSYGVTSSAVVMSDSVKQLTEVSGGLIYLPGWFLASGMNVIPVCPLVGIGENVLADVSVYPNPAGEYLSVEIPAGTDGSFTLYNTIGEIVHTEIIGSGSNAISLSGIAPGIYFYSVNNETGIIATGKIIRE